MRRVVASQHLGALAQLPRAVPQVIVVDGGRRDERGVGEAQLVAVELGVLGRAVAVDLLREVDGVDRVPLGAEDADALRRVAALVQDDIVAEHVDAVEQDRVTGRHELRSVRRVAVTQAQQLEVESVLVAEHQKVIPAVLGDRVENAGRPRHQRAPCLGGAVGRQVTDLRLVEALVADQQEPMVLGLPEVHVVQDVGLVEDDRVGGGGAAQRVAHDLVRAVRRVAATVKQRAVVAGPLQ